MEEFDGTYACVICSESVRGGDALHCAQCSSNPVHVACVRGSPFAETCAQCSGKTMRPWTGRAGGGAPSSATIDLVAAEPAASGKGKEIVDYADEDSDAGGGEGSDEHSCSGRGSGEEDDDDDDSDGAHDEGGLDGGGEEDEHDDESSEDADDEQRGDGPAA